MSLNIHSLQDPLDTKSTAASFSKQSLPLPNKANQAIYFAQQTIEKTETTPTAEINQPNSTTKKRKFSPSTNEKTTQETSCLETSSSKKPKSSISQLSSEFLGTAVDSDDFIYNTPPRYGPNIMKGRIAREPLRLVKYDIQGSLNNLRSVSERVLIIDTYDPSTGRVIHNFPYDIDCPKYNSITTYSGKILHGNLLSYEEAHHDFRVDTILTQYPIPHTSQVNRVIQSADIFWEAVSENSSFILDLTQPELIGADQRKGYAACYPKGQEKKNFGAFRIICSDRCQDIANLGTVNRFLLINTQTGTTKPVMRFHYHYWKDGTAINAQSMLDLVTHLERYSIDDTFLVHCAAGIGRSGTFTAARILYKLKIAGLLQNKKEVLKKLQDIVLLGRMQRGPKFLIDPSQLGSLYDFLDLLEGHIQ